MQVKQIGDYWIIRYEGINHVFLTEAGANNWMKANGLQTRTKAKT